MPIITYITTGTCASYVRKYLFVFMMALLTACHGVIIDEQGTLTPCTPMPEARTAAVAFAVGGKAYVLGGRNSVGCTSSMYCYDPQTDSWLGPISTPLKPRIQATAVVWNDRVYVGLGFNGTIYQDSAYLRDWWCFDPVRNTWDSLAPYPQQNTVGAISFIRDSMICCCNGSGAEVTHNMLRYHIATNTWETGLSSGTRALMGSAGAVARGVAYLGTGFALDCKDTWYSLDLHGGARMLRPVPIARTAAVAASAHDNIYLIGGRMVRGSVTGGEVFPDVLRYEPERDRWTRLGMLPQGCENAVAFTIDNHAYVGLGETFDGQLLDTFYRIDE